MTSYETYQDDNYNPKTPKLDTVIMKAKPEYNLLTDKKMSFDITSKSPKVFLKDDSKRFSHYILMQWNPEKSGTYHLEGNSEPMVFFKSTDINLLGTAHFTPSFYLFESSQNSVKPSTIDIGICDMACLQINLKYSVKFKVEKDKSYKLLIVGNTYQADQVVSLGSSDTAAAGVVMSNKYALYSQSTGKINFKLTFER